MGERGGWREQSWQMTLGLKAATLVNSVLVQYVQVDTSCTLTKENLMPRVTLCSSSYLRPHLIYTAHPPAPPPPTRAPIYPHS